MDCCLFLCERVVRRSSVPVNRHDLRNLGENLETKQMAAQQDSNGCAGGTGDGYSRRLRTTKR